jgi:hypothetical protein
VQISVPEAVPTGDVARLKCDYDLEKDLLYTIKWYRGDEEFYRFVPKESPPTRVFPLQGIHVDVSTTQLTFLLKKVTVSLAFLVQFLVSRPFYAEFLCLMCLGGDCTHSLLLLQLSTR